MASLVERLRVRSDRRPVYNIDESDDDADIKRKSGTGTSSDKIEKIERPDVVITLSFVTFRLSLLFYAFSFFLTHAFTHLV